MKRFIVLAFGFLALAFYELSGGKSFDPEATRQASKDIRLELESARSAEAEARMAALPAITGPAPLPAPATAADEDAPSATELDLASFSSVIAAERGALPEIANTPPDAPPDEPLAEPEPTSLDTTPPQPVRKTPLPTIQMTTPVTIGLSPTAPSDPQAGGIALGGLSATASSDDVTLPEDIRVVSGNRVNLRDGPGLRYRVVDQLNANTRVEVLEDAGNGWVRLRATEDDATGWVAEFLLIDG